MSLDSIHHCPFLFDDAGVACSATTNSRSAGENPRTVVPSITIARLQSRPATEMR